MSIVTRAISNLGELAKISIPVYGKQSRIWLPYSAAE